MNPTSFPLSFKDLKSMSPVISGWEAEIESATSNRNPVFLKDTNLKLENIQAGFANALHMHQPTVPAGPNGDLINHLQYMFEHTGEGDNHNAEVFSQCYARMGDFIPELVAKGNNPRIMLDYSGNLLWGLVQMGREDILNKLIHITSNSAYQPYVEWLGTMWSHAVVPSTPIPDLKLQIRAWQHQFASIFGMDALQRVKGFSPPEMHLPNNPDTLYEYIKALKSCGYRWLMVQEHTVERIDGKSLYQEDKYIPNRLVSRNSRGEVIEILALIKTQGSDTKLVAQMQPYHEAKTRGKKVIGDKTIPALVTQIADGENGGVMMNEFPRGFMPLWEELKENGRTKTGVVGINGTEYIELLEASGVKQEDYPICQGINQHKIWAKVDPNNSTPEKVDRAIKEIKETDHNFHMEGASWTNNLSWVSGYENVLEPMNQLSANFHRKYNSLMETDPAITKTSAFKEALLYNLLTQTSCFRYWGQGVWTDYAREIYKKGERALFG